MIFETVYSGFSADTLAESVPDGLDWAM